ncbi:MAG: OmpH family outer membrane protein [Stellaceae bacterium]
MSMPLPGAIRRALLIAACAALMAPSAIAAPAVQKALAPTILIVDLPAVLHDSTAGKGVQETLTRESRNYSREVARQEDSLQKMRSELERQRTVLSSNAFDVKAKQFQRHYRALDHEVQQKRLSLQHAYNSAMIQVEKKALDIIKKLAKERGANLVLAKQATILQAEGIDVTTEVVARLDKTLPSVSVSLGSSATKSRAHHRGRHHRR